MTMMRLRLTVALLVSLTPAGLLAQHRTVSTHTHPQSFHDRAPRVHDRAPHARISAVSSRA